MSAVEMTTTNLDPEPLDQLCPVCKEPCTLTQIEWAGICQVCEAAFDADDGCPNDDELDRKMWKEATRQGWA